jgi:hypothetical protein
MRCHCYCGSIFCAQILLQVQEFMNYSHKFCFCSI